MRNKARVICVYSYMLKATLTVFIFFTGIAFISVGCVTVSKVWVSIDIGLGICLILSAIIFAIIRAMRRLRN